MFWVYSGIRLVVDILSKIFEGMVDLINSRVNIDDIPVNKDRLRLLWLNFLCGMANVPVGTKDEELQKIIEVTNVNSCFWIIDFHKVDIVFVY